MYVCILFFFVGVLDAHMVPHMYSHTHGHSPALHVNISLLHSPYTRSVYHYVLVIMKCYSYKELSVYE